MANINELRLSMNVLMEGMLNFTDHLDRLENKSIHILREAYSEFKNLCMLWSVDKDSTVILWLARKAFYGHVPIPLIHIDTHYKIPEMIEHRDRLALEWKLDMIYGENTLALNHKKTFPDGKATRLECCKNLKTVALNIAEQPPEFWNQYKTDFAPGTHVRIHPLLDWTELNLWEYIEREQVPVVSLYFDQGKGTRYRSLGCLPCTTPVESSAKTVSEIVEELRNGKFSNIAERSGRAQDKEDGGGLEELRKAGYM